MITYISIFRKNSINKNKQEIKNKSVIPAIHSETAAVGWKSETDKGNVARRVSVWYSKRAGDVTH